MATRPCQIWVYHRILSRFDFLGADSTQTGKFGLFSQTFAFYSYKFDVFAYNLISAPDSNPYGVDSNSAENFQSDRIFYEPMGIIGIHSNLAPLLILRFLNLETFFLLLMTTRPFQIRVSRQFLSPIDFFSLIWRTRDKVRFLSRRSNSTRINLTFFRIISFLR